MLYFPAKVEYGLQLLITLSQNKQRLSLKQVSQQSNLPYPFLAKLTRDLVKAKIIIAKEGKGGGYLLKRPAQKINLKQVLSALGEELTLARCLAHNNCHIQQQKNCQVRLVWAKLKNNIDKQLKELTLQDLIK